MEPTERQTAKPMMTVADCAAYLSIKEATVRAYVLNDSIPFHRVGRLIRFRRPEIDAWVESQRETERAAS